MTDIQIVTTAAPIRVENLSTVPASITLSATGPRGPAGPDPWLDPVQNIAAPGGSLLIDYALGKHVRLALNGNTALAVTGWPGPNRIARLTLEITTSGAFGITEWPEGVMWQNGSAPEITANGRDMIVLTTTDGGSQIFGFIAGVNFL